MVYLDLKNEEVLSILHNITNYLEFENFVENQEADIYGKYELDYIKNRVSDSFLEEVKKDKNHVGFPLESHGMDIYELNHEKDVSYVKKQILKLTNKLSVRTLALTLVYPKHGFIGWHTNENAIGHNLILSYCTDEEGWFKYQDPTSKEIIELPSRKGWSAKYGYYGNKENNILWHCAYNTKPKLTIGMIIPNKIMRDDVVEQLEKV